MTDVLTQTLDTHRAAIERWRKLKAVPSSIEQDESVTFIVFRAADAALALADAYDARSEGQM